MFTRLLFGCAALVAVCSAPARAATLDIGTANTSNCVPFCVQAVRYQQVYAAASFANAVEISAITFLFNGGLAPGVGTATGTFNIDFWLTDRAPGALLTDLDANRGVLLGSFGGFDLNGDPGDLVFAGPAFQYDPALGNLLLEIRADGVPGVPVIAAGFLAQSPGTLFSRAFQSAGGPVTTTDVGLVTRFTLEGPAAAIPEPATWAMLVLGFAAAGRAARRHPASPAALA